MNENDFIEITTNNMSFNHVTVNVVKQGPDGEILYIKDMEIKIESNQKYSFFL